MRRLASLLVLIFLFACEPAVPEGRFACERDEDCPEEMVCRAPAQRCYSAHADAGPQGDDGAIDGGPETVDAGP